MRVAVIWSRFGPYHLSRLRAAQRLFAARGGSVLGIEVAGEGCVYGWQREETHDFERVTLFPDSPYEAQTRTAVAQRVYAALDEGRPDAVAANGYSLAEARAALRWCRRSRRCAVLLSDSKADDARRRWWREAIKGAIVRRFDAAFVAGKPHVDYIAALGMPRERIFTGCDVVDNDYFQRRAAEGREPGFNRAALHIPDRLYFLAVSRFIPRKNLLRLMQAYAGYARAVGTEPWDLVLLGEGPQRGELEAAARRLRPGHAALPGFRQIDELPFWYGLAAAFIHPALQDQWGLAVNEAMAAGLPVLVSRRAGCAQDLVEEGRNGWLFDPASADEMADAMLRLHRLSPQERRCLGRCSQESIQGWGPERFAQSLWAAARVGSAPRRPLERIVNACLLAPVFACKRST